MESNERIDNTQKTELQLLGIDKKWVWHKGQWTDQALINQPIVRENEEVEETSTKKKFWQFWKRQ